MARVLPSVLAVIVLSGAGCATTNMTVSSHVQSGLDVTRYRTYDWGKADEFPAGDPRLDKNPDFRDRVEGAVEKALALKGIQRSTSGTPDMVVHYHASISDRIDVNRTEREFGYCQGADCESWVIEYEAGTLVIDFIDARTNRLIWRGWAQDSVEGVLDNPERMVRQINEAVSRMLARFPRP